MVKSYLISRIAIWYVVILFWGDAFTWARRALWAAMGHPDWLSGNPSWLIPAINFSNELWKEGADVWLPFVLFVVVALWGLARGHLDIGPYERSKIPIIED